MQVGERVRVYYNLHKQKLSVQKKINGTWKVTDYVDEIWIGTVTFKVSEAGRRRVIKNKRKNVHAYIEGIVGEQPVNSSTPFSSIPFVSINYNPYKLEKFHDGEKYIHDADFVYILGRRVYALNPR